MARKTGKGIGSSIRALRERSKLSIAEVADLSGLDPSYLSHLELGKVANPTLSTLVGIARAFKVPIAELLNTVDAGAEDQDFQISQAVRVLLLRHAKDHKKDLLAVLKALRDPKRLEAVRNLIGR